MSPLIRSQLVIFLVMTVCGIAAGLISELFKRYSTVFGFKGMRRTATELALYAVVGVLINEFLYYCDNGKITATGMGSFLVGLWLWKRLFYGILTLTEANDGENVEEEGRSKSL